MATPMNISLPTGARPDLTQISEQILLKRLAHGDRTVFWQLWERYQPYLYRCCLRWMGGNPADAEDACSRAMLKAWDKLPKYAAKLINLKAWLARLTHNLCVGSAPQVPKTGHGT